MTDFDFNKCKNCIGRKVQGYCENCDDNDNFQHMTNADRIRTMRDEELEDFINMTETGRIPIPWHLTTREWLQQEVE